MKKNDDHECQHLEAGCCDNCKYMRNRKPSTTDSIPARTARRREPKRFGQFGAEFNTGLNTHEKTPLLLKRAMVANGTKGRDRFAAFQ